MRTCATGPTRAAASHPSGAADLHLHSSCSDGADSPARVIGRAAAAGLRAVALTDHDTTAGLAEAAAEARRLGVEFVDGVELSATTRRGTYVHLLGYFIDPAAAGLGAHSDELGRLRRGRVAEMVARLVRLGVPLDLQSVMRVAGTAPPGRPHVAEALVRARLARTTADAFGRWLHDGGPADVPLAAPSSRAVVDRIRAAGGVAALAHPSASGVGEEELRELRDLGLDAVESRHPDHSKADAARWSAVARELDLVESGGSDDHGTGRRARLGRSSVPYEWVARLGERRGR